MSEDSVLEELWRIKDARAARYGYDVRAMMRDVRKKQHEAGRQVVNLPPKRIPAAKVTP